MYITQLKQKGKHEEEMFRYHFFLEVLDYVVRE